MKKVLLHRLYREPWGEQALNFCPCWKLGGVSWNMLWDMVKTPSVSSSRDLKRSLEMQTKCKEMQTKCNLSQQEVWHKSSQGRSLPHPSYGAVNSESRRVQPSPAASQGAPACPGGARLLISVSWLAAGMWPSSAGGGEGRGWTEFSSLLGRRQSAFQSSDELGWSPDLQPYRSSLGGH